jgi:hypothetical protein
MLECCFFAALGLFKRSDDHRLLLAVRQFCRDMITIAADMRLSSIFRSSVARCFFRIIGTSPFIGTIKPFLFFVNVTFGC